MMPPMGRLIRRTVVVVTLFGVAAVLVGVAAVADTIAAAIEAGRGCHG